MANRLKYAAHRLLNEARLEEFNIAMLRHVTDGDCSLEAQSYIMKPYAIRGSFQLCRKTGLQKGVVDSLIVAG